jgi:hypothetical protein
MRLTGYPLLLTSLQLVIHERQLIFAIFPVILLLSWIRTLHSITPYSSLGTEGRELYVWNT